MDDDSPERLGAIDQAAAAAIEHALAIHRAEVVATGIVGELSSVGATAERLSTLVERLSAKTSEEIDDVIADLRVVRDRLNAENERVRRRLGEFADASATALSSAGAITENLARLKVAMRDEQARGGATGGPEQRGAAADSIGDGTT
jgi:mevalonate kinase